MYISISWMMTGRKMPNYLKKYFMRKKSRSADASEYSRKCGGGSGRRGCRTTCKSSFQSGDGSMAYFIGKDNGVMKNSEKIV